MTRAVVSLWRFTFKRVLIALTSLLVLLACAGYFMVAQPALERHASSLANDLLPDATASCAAMKSSAAQLAERNDTGIALMSVDPRSEFAASRWLLPFDAMLVAGLRSRDSIKIEARSSLDALHLSLSCDGDRVELLVDRRVALGIAPDMALLTWLSLFLVSALGLAAVLSRALSAPLARLSQHLRSTPLGAAPVAAPSTGIKELDLVAAEVAALRERVSEAVASRTALLMGMSHDLRTPLTRVRLILDTARPMQDEDLLEMKSHLLEMQDAMDEFMRAANAIASPPVRLGAQLTWSRLQSLFDRTRVTFIGNPGEFETALNSAALLRIACNFIDNALRHGEGKVEVSWQHSGESWCLCVADQGRGIPEQNMARVLRPFASDGSQRSDAPPHAGIGLALVRILCEHNGWQWQIKPGRSQGLQVCVRSMPK